MPTINKEDMTITIVCQTEDEAGARVELQELLEANPGYKPVLTVEDSEGNETTHTDLNKLAKASLGNLDHVTPCLANMLGVIPGGSPAAIAASVIS